MTFSDRLPLEVLLKTAPKSFAVFEERDEREHGSCVYRWQQSGASAVVLRGDKMKTVDALMDETAAALQFPYYFGENWAALDECLSDIEWPKPPPALVLVIRDADRVLTRKRGQLEVFVQTLDRAAEAYESPIEGTTWDRPAVPFRVVLVTHSAPSVETLWGKAGAQLELVP